MSGEEFHFGQFRFDPVNRKLSRSGAPVRIGARAAETLRVLALARGAVVSKDELLSKVWPGVTVEENNLQVQISALRKVLEGEQSGQAHLVTVPGRGYRLVGAAEPGPALPERPSIAVLPFQNMSDDPGQEYFADGIVDDIVTALCRIRWLFVIARAKRKPTENLDAYDYFLRGLSSVHLLTPSGVGEALQLFDKSVERDPDFASPYGLAAFCYVMRKMNGWADDAKADAAEAERLALRAAQAGKDDAVALAFGGLALGYVVGDLDEAAGLIERALMLNPNLAIA